MSLKPEVIQALEREKKMCEIAIARLHEKVHMWENQFGWSTHMFLQKFNSGEVGDDVEYFRWYALAQAIREWQLTYDALQEVLAE